MEYKKRLGEKIAEKRAFDLEQQKLRKKYKVYEDGIIQVKRKHMLEILLHAAAYIIRTGSMIILLVLAALGLISLIYTGPRSELIVILQEVIGQLHTMLGV